METTVGKRLLDWYRVFVQLGPVANERGERLGVKPRKAVLKTLDRIGAGTASDQEQIWFSQFVASVEAARKRFPNMPEKDTGVMTLRLFEE